MHYLLILPLILFALSGCEDKEKIKREQTLLINKAKEELRITLQKEMATRESLFQKKLAKKENELQELKTQLNHTQQKVQTLAEKLQAQETLLIKHKNLSKTGVLIDGDTLIIDANKTQSYFNNIGEQLKNKLSKFTSDFEKGVVQEKDAGIEINESRINIDLNKTKTLIEVWGKKIQEIAKDFDSTSKVQNTNTH